MTKAGRRVVVVGASVAGVHTARMLRSHGYEGPVVLLDRDQRIPYDKPALSKDVLTTCDGTPPSLISDAEVDRLEIELKSGITASELDMRGRRLLVEGNTPIPFSELVIATGSKPRTIPALQGVDGVHYLRTYDDALKIRDTFSRRPKVVIVGGGFIGCEVAASARTLGLSVTIVEAAGRLLGRLMPTEVSAAITRLHRDHGVAVMCQRKVRGYRGGQCVEALELDDGSCIDADVVIVGIGTLPDTGWLANSGITIRDGVICGSDLAALNAPGVYTAGDVTRWCSSDGSATYRTEHWTSAREQGAMVAYNLTHHEQPRHFASDGYVWSDQFGIRIQHAGRYSENMRVEARRSESGNGQIFAYYDNARLVGATALDAARDMLTTRQELARAPY